MISSKVTVLPEACVSTDASDDRKFVELVERLILGAATATRSRNVYVIKVDHWFGPNWLDFGGKVLGAVGVRQDPKHAVVPPFIPSRILSQKCFVLDSSAACYRAFEADCPVHIAASSESNLRRRIAEHFPEASFFWWTGQSVKEQRGALMAYLESDVGFWTWYADFSSPNWMPRTLRGISRSEIGFW